MIYFDNAATTGKKPDAVINAVNYALKNLCANPGRSGHLLSEKAAIAVYNSRKSVSDFFAADGPENVVFTSNCTQSINFVLKGILNEGDHIVISDLEHNAVMRPLSKMNIDYTAAAVSLTDDAKTVECFENALRPNTKMIFCTAASNVLGKTLPLKEIGMLCLKKGILFGVDAAQGAGMMNINMKDMNIDFLCVAAHKGLYCPMGLGILIAKKSIENTIIEGGTGTDSLSLVQPQALPEMLESGTINLPSIVSIPYGIGFIEKNKNLLKYENELVKYFFNSLQQYDVSFYTNPNIASTVPVLSFNVKNLSSEQVGSILSKKGFALRSGLHCAPCAHQKIGTLKRGTVRFSPSAFNKQYEVKLLIEEIKKI